MIERLLPGAVAAHESFGDLDDARLLPAERDWIASSTAAGRRQEFATVRHLARAGMRDLGRPPQPVLPGAGRAPRWPEGLVGAITHCAGYRAAVLARSSEVPGLGIDAEPNRALSAGALGAISHPEERDQLAGLAREFPEVHWDRLLFSAKESVYKVWYPLAGRWLGFRDARVEFDPLGGRFTVRLLVAGPVLAGAPLQELDGRWQHAHGLLTTAIALGPGDRALNAR
ncbi:4'-phosphopantetheinyl transferase superfamily protein [Kitasatospora sp. NPDC097643]|uniref:4'-phosphopantetheinyl transferase family protein n=1 Tax=Kitasatospora sp. NPDC097643 TaxID=3157230 RepID=UPI003323726A